MRRIFKHKKLNVFICVVAIILGAAYFAINSLNSPAVGTVNSQASLSSLNDYSTPKTVSYNGKYLSFTYPSRYRPVSSSLSGSYLEVYSLYSSDHSQINITIGVIRESLSQDSGIMYRLQHPSIYKQTGSTANTISFTSNQNGYEQDEFISHNGLVASVVLAAPTSSTAGGDFNSITGSFVWN